MNVSKRTLGAYMWRHLAVSAENRRHTLLSAPCNYQEMAPRLNSIGNSVVCERT